MPDNQSLKTQYEIKKTAAQHLYYAIGSINKEVANTQLRLNDLREQQHQHQFPHFEETIGPSPSELRDEEIKSLLNRLVILAAARKEVQNVIKRYQYS